MVVPLNTEPELETSDARFVKVTNHKYRTELQRLTQRLEKERKEREKSEQDADQDETINLANKKPRIEEPSNYEQPSTSKMQ